MYLSENLGYSHGSVALFTLSGLVTPPCMLLAGKLLDRGHGRRIMLAGLGCILLAWGLLLLQDAWISIFAVSALLLDPSSSAVTVSTQQALLAHAPPDARGRINALNISMNFLGGAAGAAIGPWMLTGRGMPAVLLAGGALSLALLGFVALARCEQDKKEE